MRLSFKKILGICFSALVVSFAVFQIFSISQSAEKKLADERARLIEQNRVPFQKKTLIPHTSQNIQILQNTNTVKDFVRFQDSYFAATTGGLVQFSPGGEKIRHFTVSDGLPESDLTCLAVFRGELFIGTQSENLLAFDGENFENYIWTDRKAQAVTSLLEANGKLLIGTMAGGLIEFDGQTFAEIKADKTRISAVNYLFKNGSRIYIGTFDNGLWIYENALWSHLTTADGLPSNRVVGIGIKDKKLFVATDFGLALLEDKTFRTIATLPALSSLITVGDHLFLTKASGEIFVFNDSIKEVAAKENSQDARLIFAGEKIWLLSNQAVSEFQGTKLKPFGKEDSDVLTDNFVSAITFDKYENLWIGTFRRGIDVFTAGGKKLKHLEAENVREINYLASGGESVLAATSSGLIDFQADFSLENLTKKDGLPSNSVTHFSGAFIATAKGLALREREKIRFLSTVQGLPNNSVYTILQNGETLYAGTLGGLAKIENGRVAQTFKDSNSNLTTNWVTALCRVDERLFIGTYGGGLFELLPSGQVRSFESETGKFTVNPNAMFSDGERLYIGTLAGLKLFDLKTQGWRTLKNFLPAQTVLSITGNGEDIYFGTTNGIAKVRKNYFAAGESE
jgi:ligand-binding sensor domain-containing protein